MKTVSFSLEQGNKYYGKIDGQRFYIGQRTSYKGGKGLVNEIGTASQKYDRALYRPEFGFWADFIHPTAACEGVLYHTLNTYDQARFTFGFLQYAAHVPDGDFVIYLRTLLDLPLAKEYFQDLSLQKNRICRITDSGTYTPLESNTSTAGLLDYLNPTLSEIEDTEVLISAKFIHWVQNDPLHRHAQVQVGIDLFKANMLNYATSYHLDGAADTICLVIADIRHQGRAKSAVIVNALQSDHPLDTLLTIGEGSYPDRVATLRKEINALLKDGTLGKRTYSIAHQDFI